MSLNERSSRFFLQDINQAEVHHNSYGGLVSFKKENMIIASMSNSCLRFNDEVKNTTRLILHKNKNIPHRNEVVDYVNTRDEKIDVDNFIDYYTSNGWKVGKNNMRDWKAAVRQWERRQKERKDEKRKSDNGRTPTDAWLNPDVF